MKRKWLALLLSCTMVVNTGVLPVAATTLDSESTVVEQVNQDDTEVPAEEGTLKAESNFEEIAEDEDTLPVDLESDTCWTEGEKARTIRLGEENNIKDVFDYAAIAEKLDTSRLSGWDNINPLYQGQFFDPDNEYTVPYGAGIPLIVYDPDMVDIDIKGYSDLWDPSLEDSVALIGNYRVLNGITNLTLGQDFNDQDVDDIKKTGEKLLELAPNVRLIQDDNTQNALLNGEASVGFLYTSQVTAALQENPDLKVVYPEEGLGFGVIGMFIPSQAPDNDEAYQFVDYILQPENAAKCFDYIGYYCTNKAADSLLENQDLVVPDAVTEGFSVENVSAEAEEQYNKNWTEFKAACD